MARHIIRSVLLLATIIGGWVGIQVYEKSTHTAELRAKDEIIEKEKQKNELLRGIVKRLQTDKRIARIIVTNQTQEEGHTWTTLLFAEYARDGKTILPEKRFVIDGKGAHIDAHIIEFDGKYVEENEPLRGHSIALFKRIFGDNQTPAAGFAIDSPGEAPELYKDADPRQQKLEADLWKDFWKLADDPELRKQWGVKLAYGSSSFREEFNKGYIYTLVLSPTGGLKMSSEKMDPIIEKALSEAGNR